MRTNSEHEISHYKEIHEQNFDLKSKLKQAQQVISQLKQEIIFLKQKLLQYEPPLHPVHRTQQKMQVQEEFQHSSDSSDDVFTNSFFHPNHPTHHPNNNSNQISSNHKKDIGSTAKQSKARELIKEKPTLRIDPYNFEEDDISIEAGLTKQNSRINLSPISRMQIRTRQKNEIKSTKNLQLQKWKSVTGETDLPIEKKLFKRISNAKPIFDYFLVTGMNQITPTVNYFYPKKSPHFDAILSLVYSENSVKQPEVSPSNSKAKMNQNSSMTSISVGSPICVGSPIKDVFVILLRKELGEADSNEKQYLIACEVQDKITEKQYQGWSFPRYYCFITSCHFINQFKKLITQFLDRIIIAKNNQLQTVSEKGLSQLIQKQIEPALKNLYEKNADDNKNLNYYIGQNIRFVMDIPSVDNSYKLIDQYKIHDILNAKVTVQIKKDLSGLLEEKELKLFGVLIIYLLAEIKIVLFSSIKSRISEAILHALEIIKPFSYVNPILIAALREEHQEYLSAPMSIVLGLWAEPKKSYKQKIEIFMNKKLNLIGLIEKAKLQINDGIIINLDTGLIFGGGLSQKLMEVAYKLNHVKESCKNPRDVYKLFERMVASKSQNDVFGEIFGEVRSVIQKTQLFCYYNQNKEKR